MATKKNTCGGFPSLDEIDHIVRSLDERTPLREITSRWIKNLPDDLSADGRLERIERALLCRSVFLDLLPGLGSLEETEDRLNEAFDAGFEDLVQLYLRTNEIAIRMMQGLEALLVDYAYVPTAGEIRREQAVTAAKVKTDIDPKSVAMREIRAEWEKRGKPGAAFAREMATLYQQRGVELSEGGIKNRIGQWRKNSSSSQ